jgi:A/G-specific adenine glycosylase
VAAQAGGSLPSEAPLTPRAAALRSWYRRARRPLPWRKDRDPYHLWVAEVLLQQTRVAQAVPYYERFLARFPTLPSLARAPLADVLKAWEGAGYYARARRLRAAARRVLRERAGRLPRRSEELRHLPGFGPYIAAAVASLAFGERVPALEANGIRVLARWHLRRGPLGGASARRELAEHLREELPADRPGEINEAVMELGETICLPRAPRCPICPVAAHCAARRELPDPGAIPEPARRARRPHVRAAVVVLERRGRWLVQRRPPEGLLGGLWEFPGGKIRPGESAEAAARRELREETGFRVGGLERVGVVRHAYSHFTVELHAFRARAPAEAPARAPRALRWLTPAEFATRARPRATLRIVERLGSPLPVARGRSPSRRPASKLLREDT